MPRSKQPPSPAHPVLEGVDYTVDANGCWLWLHYIDPNGYGRTYNRPLRKIQWAHRYSYELARGPIPAGKELDHECQVTRCVNPAHLAPVTRVEHARRTMQRLGKDDLHTRAASLRHLGLTYDEIAEALQLRGKETAFAAVKAAVRKGLVAAEDVPPCLKLTEAERDDIRELFAAGIPQTVIGRFYGIDSSQISRICSERERRGLKAAS